MAITKAEKAAYNDYVKDFKVEIEDNLKSIKDLEARRKKMANISGYLSVELCLKYLKNVQIYMKMSDASQEMLHIRNEKFLDNSRKDFYKVVQLLEEMLGNDIERSLNDNKEYLRKIDKLNPAQVLKIIRTIMSVFNSLLKRMGESKWKWSFVDLQGRIAVLVKNFINFSDLQKNRDPRMEFYRDRQELMRVCKSVLNEAAKQFRNKYELSTKVPEDILKSINLLAALRSIHILFGESEDATKLKNTIDALRARLEADEVKDEEDKKKKKK
ncbi:MAG TPA: hypothetical protein PKJ16_17465 [Spirochaetota bacterium]|nr:hypothetical protein [Spirochaetota bacterium]HOS39179.1 hypothetical protein [Spirochaetota bacterium]HPU90356.1 hypothetical protein [Spirochaetota bacterium]